MVSNALRKFGSWLNEVVHMHYVHSKLLYMVINAYLCPTELSLFFYLLRGHSFMGIFNLCFSTTTS